MPAISRNQRITAAIAKHHPEQLYSRNRGMLSMSNTQLHHYASTPEKGLPKRKLKAPKKRRLADHLTALRSTGKFMRRAAPMR